MERIGYENTLSTLILGCAESGAGKSRSLEPFLNAIKILQAPLSESDRLNYDLDMGRLNALKKQYNKNGDLSLKVEIEKLTLGIKNIKQDVLLVSDITREAFLDLMSQQGFVLRIEPDGTHLKHTLDDLVRKVWSNEPHSEVVISRKSNSYINSLIVSLVYTQPEFFYDYIRNRTDLHSGLLARTLCYRINPRTNFTKDTPERNISRECQEAIALLFKRIFSASSIRPNPIILHLEPAAEDLWLRVKKDYREKITDYYIEGIKEWITRAAQHTLRLSGILHLIESDCQDNVLISVEEVKAAKDIVDILYENLFFNLIGYGERREKKCTCEVGVYILKENYHFFNETDIKQRFKDKYKADEVSVALDNLERRRIIKKRNKYFERSGPGRPRGREFENNYYELRLTFLERRE